MPDRLAAQTPLRWSCGKPWPFLFGQSLKKRGRILGFLSSCWPARRWQRVPAVLVLFGTAQLLQAVTLTTSDRQQIAQEADRNDGWAGVMVTVTWASLDDIRDRGSDAIRTETELIASALRAELGARVLPTGHWNNGMGQIGLLVIADGLQTLERSPQVLALQPDASRGLRDKAWMTPDGQAAIEQSVRDHGAVTLELALNSEIDYQIGVDGSTAWVHSEAAAAAHANALEALADAAGAGLQVLDDQAARAGNPALVRVRADRAARMALRMAPQVRAIRAGLPPGDWPASVLSIAAAEGSADVMLTLRGGDTYSPNQGYMSAAAWAVQIRAHEAALQALLADTGASGAARKLHAGIGVLSARLSWQSLETLCARRDPRIRAVELNRPMGQPALSNSMPLVNMPVAWAAGHRGDCAVVSVALSRNGTPPYPWQAEPSPTTVPTLTDFNLSGSAEACFDETRTGVFIAPFAPGEKLKLTMFVKGDGNADQLESDVDMIDISQWPDWGVC